MDYESMPFGIKLSAFLGVIVVLTYAVAAVALASDEDSAIKIEYAALVP